MKALSCIVLLWPCIVFAQTEKLGSLINLALQNGFKYDFAGTDIHNISGGKLIYMDGDGQLDADSCVKYQFTDTALLNINKSLTLDMVGVRAYKNKIANVYLFFKKADGYKVLSYFLNQFGLFTNRPSAFEDIYYWDTNQVSLTLKYQLNTDLGVAIITYKQLDNMVAEKVANPKLKQNEIFYSAY